MKKRIFLILVLIISLLSINIWAKDASISGETDMSKAKITISQDTVIKSIKVYKKVGDKYYLIDQNTPNSREATFTIAKNKLSKTEKTKIKIVIIDIDNNKETKDFEIDTLKEPAPTQTSQPPVSPSPTSSQTPTPSSTPGEIQVQKVTLNKSSITIKKGSNIQLSATITPNNASNKTLTWTTSNKNIATVDKNGKVTAVKEGTATITAKSNNNVKGTCQVTVQAVISSSTKPKSAKGNGYTQTIKLGGRTFKLYKQYKGTYSSKHYNSVSNKRSSGTIANMGCGPSSVAIVLSGYGYNYNPYDVGKKLMKNSKPSGLPSMEKEIKAMGMKVKKHTYTSNYNTAYSQMKQALENGHQIVLYVGKKGNQSAWKNFTDSGYHFISILGMDSSNKKVFVGNPSKASGWFDLSTVVKARGNTNGNMAGWIELYK